MTIPGPVVEEAGSIYVICGALSAILSMVGAPLLGLLAVVCGVQLYRTERESVLSALLIGLGGFGLLAGIAYSVTL